MAASTEAKTLTGGCHCGFIRYTVKVTPADDGIFTAFRCNCTYCQKLANTNLSFKDTPDFTLLSPADASEVHGYAGTNKEFARKFCHKCGAHVWMDGYYRFPLPDGTETRVHHCSVNLPTLDQPQPGIDLSKVRIKYWDGLTNNFEGGLKDEPWPNGMR